MGSPYTEAAAAFIAIFAMTACDDDRTHPLLPPVSAGGVDRPADRAEGSGASGEAQLTRQIRERITADRYMSGDARNVEVATLGGVVTLKGAVESAGERAIIEALARDLGAKQIENQLEIDRKNRSTSK